MLLKKYFFVIVMFSVLFSCTEEDIKEKVQVVDSWISEIDSVEEDGYNRYTLGIDDESNYLAVSQNRILRLDKNGEMLLNINNAFESEEEIFLKQRIFNNTIYSFKTTYSVSLEDYNPDGKIELDIYNNSGDLIENLELDTGGNFLRDVEIEDENTFGMLFYNPTDSSLTLKRVKKNEGIVEEVLVHSSGSSGNLHISETGEYFCTLSASPIVNFYFFDNNLNLKWSKAFKGMLIHSAKSVQGKGIYIAGSQTPYESFINFIALISENGVEMTKYEYQSNNDDWLYEMWVQDLQVSSDGSRVALLESVAEITTNSRVLLFDEDLNLDSSLVVEGNIGLSNLVENENNSFSFMNSIKADDTDTSSFPITNPRFFKLNEDFVLPEIHYFQ